MDNSQPLGDITNTPPSMNYEYVIPDARKPASNNLPRHEPSYLQPVNYSVDTRKPASHQQLPTTETDGQGKSYYNLSPTPSTPPSPRGDINTPSTTKYEYVVPDTRKPASNDQFIATGQTKPGYLPPVTQIGQGPNYYNLSPTSSTSPASPVGDSSTPSTNKYENVLPDTRKPASSDQLPTGQTGHEPVTQTEQGQNYYNLNPSRPTSPASPNKQPNNNARRPAAYENITSPGTP